MMTISAIIHVFYFIDLRQNSVQGGSSGASPQNASPSGQGGSSGSGGGSGAQNN